MNEQTDLELLEDAIVKMFSPVFSGHKTDIIQELKSQINIDGVNILGIIARINSNKQYKDFFELSLSEKTDFWNMLENLLCKIDFEQLTSSDVGLNFISNFDIISRKQLALWDADKDALLVRYNSYDVVAFPGDIPNDNQKMKALGNFVGRKTGLPVCVVMEDDCEFFRLETFKKCS